MSEQDPNEYVEQFPDRFHRDRSVPGGEIHRLNEEQLARLAEEERVAAGVDDYDPDAVPPATDAAPLTSDVRQSEAYREERAEAARQEAEGQLRPVDEAHPFPPTRYED